MAVRTIMNGVQCSWRAKALTPENSSFSNSIGSSKVVKLRDLFRIRLLLKFSCDKGKESCFCQYISTSLKYPFCIASRSQSAKSANPKETSGKGDVPPLEKASYRSHNFLRKIRIDVWSIIM